MSKSWVHEPPTFLHITLYHTPTVGYLPFPPPSFLSVSSCLICRTFLPITTSFTISTHERSGRTADCRSPSSIPRQFLIDMNKLIACFLENIARNGIFRYPARITINIRTYSLDAPLGFCHEGRKFSTRFAAFLPRGYRVHQSIFDCKRQSYHFKSAHRTSEGLG